MLKYFTLFIKQKFIIHEAFAKNSFILFCGTAIGNVLNYFFHLAVGRYVSIQTYGEAESLISLIAIISVPAATLSMVATKYAAACKSEGNIAGSRDILNYLNKKVFLYGLPIFAIAVLMTPVIGSFLRTGSNFALILIWISMFLSFLAAVNSGILGGWQKFKEVSFMGVWGAATKLIAGVFFVSAGFSLNGVIGGYVVGILIVYIVSVMALRFITAKNDRRDKSKCETKINVKSMRKYIMPVFVGNLAITILGNADMILAKRNLDALSAGQYGALTVVSKIIFFATGILASVLFSMAAENNHKGNSSRHILSLTLLAVMAISLVATGIYFLYPEWVLSVLFRNKYQSVEGYLGWFAVAVMLFSLSNVIFQYLLSLHKTKIVYALLLVAIMFSGAIFIYGKNIYDILMILIISQATALVLGVFFLFAGKNKLYYNKFKI